MKRLTLLLLAPGLLIVGGCSVQEVIEAEETELVVADADTAQDEALLLDIDARQESA